MEELRVLVLDTLLQQADKSNRRLPADVLPRLYKEYRTLAKLEKEGFNALYAYLTQNNNGKQMQGVNGITIFKYDLTKGDRILYAYGKDLPFLQKEKDSLVLLGYSNHDNQGSMAKRTDFKKSHDFAYLSNVVKNLNSVSLENEILTEEELYEVASFLLSESFTGYAYTDEELCQFSADDIEKHLLLSEEQKDVIVEYQLEKAPTLIMGGAGTGKTLIAVHMLNNVFNDTESISIAYFTQSRILLNKVKEQYKQLRSETDDSHSSIVDFWDINKFCLDLIDVKEKNLINTKHFIEVFMKQKLPSSPKGQALLEKLKKQNISFDNVWTEIRGTLKGGMKNWIRVSPMSQDDVSFNVKKYEDLGYIERLPDNKKLFQLKDTIAKTTEKMNSDISLESNDKKIINEIISYFSTFNPKLKSISIESYLALNDEFSVLSKEQRKIIVEIYYEYERYLELNDLVDDNDVVRKVIESGYHKNNIYDFIFVDEIQDYTELQTYFINELVADKNNIVFAGDVHQIINPTLFSVSKLKELFNNNTTNEKIRERFLSTNFRCQKGVVDVANRLSELRRQYIGSQKREMEQAEKSNVNICLYDPYRLEYSESNIQRLMHEIIKYPQVAVLVPDTKTKENLWEYVKDFDRPDFIFTVDEIKGMEYDYVVCYNLIDYYQDAWKKLTETDIRDTRTKYRFYFNLIYVAITRAKKMLCFLDENSLSTIENALELKYEPDFDADLLHFSDLDASVYGWLKQANEYKQQGKFKNALQFYNIVKNDANIIDIYDCHIGLAEEERDYETAIKYAILKLAFLESSNETSESTFEQLQYFSKQLDKNSQIKKLADFVINSEKNVSNLAALLENEFIDFEENEKNIISNYFINSLELLMIEKLDKKRVPEIRKQV